MKIEVKQDIKLLDFVRLSFPEVSASKAKKMILYNCFSVGGAAVKSFEYILHKGSVVEYQKYSGGKHISKEKRDVTVVYEDKDIIVVNKSSMQNVFNQKNDKTDQSVFSLTKSYLKRKYHKNELYLYFAPEYDEYGLCLMAKNKIALKNLENQKDNLSVNVTAIVKGELKHKNDKIRFAVRTDNNGYSVLDSNTGKDGNAETYFLQYNTLKEIICKEEKLYEINIKHSSLRPYLNRFLLKNIGNPVLGDRKYFSGKKDLVLLRYAVNCIELLSPLTGKKLKIECCLPKSFEKTGVATEENNLNK